MSFWFIAQATVFLIERFPKLRNLTENKAVIRFVPFSFLFCCAVERLASLHPIVSKILVYYSRLP